MNAASRRQDFDVVIAGGGMIGTSLAIALAPLGLRVALVEAVGREAAVQPSFDERSTVLSRSSQRLFAALGLWTDIASAATPITAVRVSDQGRFGFARIDAEEQNVEALGYVVVNRVLGNVLHAALDRLDTAVTWCPARVEGIRSDGVNPVQVEISGEGGVETLRARLLVAADGARSMVRARLGIGVEERDYGQQAIVGNLSPDLPHGHVAWERFTRAGPVAMLPFGKGRVAFIWTVAGDDAPRVLALPDSAFLSELQSQFGMRLGRFTAVSRRAAYPLRLTRAMRLHAPRAVLIGNAAHGLHPVAAQGFNLGLRDVAVLCDCIAEAMAEHGDPGSDAVVERYAAWRHDDQRKLVLLTDGLVGLFGAPGPGTGLLRNAGMLGFDLVPGIRDEFARQTMGLAGRLPRLSRGVPLQ